MQSDKVPDELREHLTDIEDPDGINCSGISNVITTIYNIFDL